MAITDQILIAAAQPHGGLLPKATLEQLGVSRQALRTRVADGRLVRVQPNVYLLGGTSFTWTRRLRAAALTTGGVVSHMAAAARHGFERIGEGAVEITVDRRRLPTIHNGRLHRTAYLPLEDIDRSGPFPVTLPERTLIDIATRVGSRRLRAVIDDACRQGLVDKDRLRRRLDAWRRHGIGGVRPVAALVHESGFEPVLDSWLERRAKAVIDGSSLPPGDWQVWSAPDGRAARVDLRFSHSRLVVEFDGHGTHATRAERQADAERMARLTAAATA